MRARKEKREQENALFSRGLLSCFQPNIRCHTLARRIDQPPSLPPSGAGRGIWWAGRRLGFSSSSGPSATIQRQNGRSKVSRTLGCPGEAARAGEARGARQLLKSGALWGGPTPRRKQGRPPELPLWKERLGRGANRRRGVAGSQPKAAYRSQRAQPAEARCFANRGRDRAAAGVRRAVRRGSGLPGPTRTPSRNAPYPSGLAKCRLLPPERTCATAAASPPVGCSRGRASRARCSAPGREGTHLGGRRAGGGRRRGQGSGGAPFSSKQPRALRASPCLAGQPAARAPRSTGRMVSLVRPAPFSSPAAPGHRMGAGARGQTATQKRGGALRGRRSRASRAGRRARGSPDAPRVRRHFCATRHWSSARPGRGERPPDRPSP